MLFQLIFFVETLVAQCTHERPLVHGAMLNEIGPGGELLVTEIAGVRAVAVVQVLMFHQDVFVAEASVADVALVWLLA